MAVEKWGCPVRAWAEKPPNSVAVRSTQHNWTYAELDGRVGTAVYRLRAHDVVAGDRVAVYAKASADVLAVMVAAFRVGAALCPLNLRLPGAQVSATAAQVGARLLVADRSVDAGAVCVCDLGELLAPEAPESGEAEVWPDCPAAVLMTSGSMGSPKAAVLTYRNLVRNAEASNRNIALAPGDVWLLSLPLYHVSGLGVLFRCMLAGATVAIPDAGESLVDAMTRLRPTHVSLVATQLRGWLEDDAGVAALSGCKAILLGGSALPEALIRDAHARGLPIYTSYGLTEMGSQVTTTSPGADVAELLTAGRPLRDGTIEIDADGEIRVRGETRFAGYWQDGVLETPFDDAGWFRTGDLGAWADSGRLLVLGRKDNLIISGGENIQPEEVEAALLALPGVLRAAVLPVNDAVYGQRPVAFVLTRSGEVDEAALRADSGVRLAKYKVPDRFYAWPEALRGREGKISRGEWEGFLDGAW